MVVNDRKMSVNNSGFRWGITFLTTSTAISEESREELFYHATGMYLRKEGEREVKEGDYEGMVSTIWKYDVLGSFAGVRFDADLETEKGKIKLRFLVSEQTGGRGIAYSQN